MFRHKHFELISYANNFATFVSFEFSALRHPDTLRQLLSKKNLQVGDSEISGVKRTEISQIYL